jgi:hypothetical protein
MNWERVEGSRGLVQDINLEFPRGITQKLRIADLRAEI